MASELITLNPGFFSTMSGGYVWGFWPTINGDYRAKCLPDSAITLLLAFRNPCAVEGLSPKIVSQFGDQLMQVIAEFIKLRILLNSPSVQDVCLNPISDIEAIVESATELAWDIRGLGQIGTVNQDDALGQISYDLRGVRLALAAAQARITPIRENVQASRKANINGLIGAGPVRLNLGCGSVHLTSWINLDMPPAPLEWVLQWGLPFDDATVDYVYFGHSLEHIDYGQPIRAILTEVKRVMKRGAVIRIVVPDIGQFAKAYADEDFGFFDAFEMHWKTSNPWIATHPTPLSKLLRYAGVGNTSGTNDTHRFGYDFITLKTLLLDVGFSDIISSEYMLSAHDALRVDMGWAAGIKYCERAFSLFVEATVK